jgi:MFS family permease
MFIAVMDQTIVNVALATIGRDFHASAAGVAGTVIGYQVAVALSIPAAAWLGDRLGPRQVLLGAIAVFTVASALCGLASGLGELVAFRVLQGIGGGLMTPVGMTMLFRAFPPAERVRASSILVIPTALAPGGRADHRRRIRYRRVVAVGVLRERPHRDLRARLRHAVPRRPGPPGRGAL